MAIEKIAFIGTGVMGHSMVLNLLKQGYALTVYNRTASKAQDLAKYGAVVAQSVKDAVKDADLVISIVGYPKDVREIWLSAEGIIANMKEGAIGLDMTTSEPALAKEITAAGAARGLLIGDAPVTGGDVGAKNGTLAILFGGSEELFAKVQEPCSAMGKTLVRFGEAGAGQYAKICNQIAIAAGMMALCECIATAKKVGLDEALVIDTLSKGAAGSFSMNSYGPRILKGDFNPGFFIKHFVKDLKIALDAARACGLTLPGTELAYKFYCTLENEGLGELGTQALYKYYEEHCGA
ncbi:MAG: NAD(P)-dependent oxidoreductase [Proteobacteria bacterium]|uniref:NAD(P)-dependent oxidoreductase n=1 Tax=Candidatus Avisuccinivibrio stercorigallinarum TaxID=2840704 RepID=A0A9D9DAB3_9GAMM|nr:NAD(P)-dependent oxidoreductase [Candidatus Avisuccinivibrio stercorigallinarum]